MLATLLVVEFAVCGLAVSTIAWLRYLRGAPMSRDWHVTGARYLVPFLVVLLIVSFILMSIQRPTGINANMQPSDILGPSVVSAALLLWLVVEVLRFRTRPRDIRHGNHSYSRIAPPQRRAKLGKGKNRTR